MAMASLTSGLLVRKGHARPSSFKPSSKTFRFENDDAVELLEENQRLAAAQTSSFNTTKLQPKKKISTLSAVQNAKPKDTKPIKSEVVADTKNVASTDNAPVARKTIRIRQDLNVTLKVLAARTGMSQKDIIETALANYLEEKRQEFDCICGADEL